MDRWLVIFIVLGAVAISIYGINQYFQNKHEETSLINQGEIKDQNNLILIQINRSLTAAHAEDKQALDERKHEHQQIISNITAVLKRLNVTVIVNGNSDSTTENNETEGKISAFVGNPEQILNATN